MINNFHVDEGNAPQLGQVFLVIDPQSFAGSNSFAQRIEVLIAAMQKANSADPAKYLPELAKISHNGASGKIEFDDKGDRKDAEMTIFIMKGGRIEPVAIVKGGQSIKYEDYAKAAAPAPAAAPAAAPAPEKK